MFTLMLAGESGSTASPTFHLPITILRALQMFQKDTSSSRCCISRANFKTVYPLQRLRLAEGRERTYYVVPPLAFSQQGRPLSRHHCSYGDHSLLDPWAPNMSKSSLHIFGFSVPCRHSCFIWRWAAWRKKKSRILSRNGSFEKLGKIGFTAVSLFCDLVWGPQALF